DSGKKTFPGTRDLDLIQSTPFDTLSLKTPPRVLTLSDRPLDFLEDEQRAAPDTDDTMRPQARMRRERSASENISIRPGGLTHNDSASPASSSSATTDPSNPPLTMADEEHNMYSASGVLSFVQSTTRRAYQQVLEVLDESPHSSIAFVEHEILTPVALLFLRLALSTYEASFDTGADDLTMVDAATLRRQ
ncbi:hypothetical protein NL108_002777, partial [Boleophthalmus pectinirostris]